jgi:tRNA-dihydrouridine synthase B
LAPLAGFSDLPFRLLCREYGAASCVTEMISAKGIFFNGNNTWKLLRTNSSDQPLVVQLFGTDPSTLREAVHVLREAGHGWFDLNMGCSVPKVLRQGAGAALLKDVGHAVSIARAMLDAAGRGRVGFKLRLVDDGLGNSSAMDDLCLGLADAGAGWLTLHPRTARQGFGGEARWERIAHLVSLVDVPVLASGDLFTALDGRRCLAETGAAGLMYARGALRDPAVFGDHLALEQGLPAPPKTLASIARMIRRHMDLAIEHGDGDASLLKMRCVIPRYLHGIAGAKRLRVDICRCRTWPELEALVTDFFRHGESLAQRPSPGAARRDPWTETAPSG